MKKEKNKWKILIKLLDSLANMLIFSVVLLIFGYSIYVMWDFHRVYQEADFRQYEKYCPENSQKSAFEELKEKNSEIIGWITVFDTHIDYPFAQAEDNEKYVNIDIEGNYSLGGSIFLDCSNEKDFSNELSIFYGHHMAKRTMFGDIEEFRKQEYLDTHTTGNLYYGGEDHEVEFFAFLEADAYDYEIYCPTLRKEDKEAYLQKIYQKASCKRQIEIRKEEHLVLLSTCNSETTNGRYILVGKVAAEE
ncbi:MAG: class B sortase [Bacillota bacterium]|nr:class B sortase [Bacillota bacterium]